MIQPDQKIVVCAAGSLGAALYRLLPNGDPDPAFAGGGAIPAGASGCGDVAVLADGRIAVASFPGGDDSLVSADGASVTALVLSAFISGVNCTASIATNKPPSLVGTSWLVAR